MNFLDTYDLARPETPSPADPPPPTQPSLNEEVNQVIGQLGRFWGGFRKQSQTALEAARKDLSGVVEQAQKELTKLTASEGAPQARAGPAEGSGGSATPAAPGASPEAPAEGDSAAQSPAPAPASGPATAPGEGAPSLAASTGAIFARLQSALPPQLVASVQTNLAQTGEQLRAASASATAGLDLPALRTNVLAELQRVQDATGGCAQRSEALLREAVREAGDVLREAVKVLPPDEGRAGAGAGAVRSAQGLVWDGADMWMLPGDAGEAPRRMSESAARPGPAGVDAQSAVATRAEALLRRLKRDADIVRHDPAAEEGVRERYLAWKAAEVDALEGGVEGAEWAARVAAELEEADGQALKQLEESLVPSEMTSSEFWLRFFFRRHQIRAEEEKRKALIQSTADTDEDFSWEDDEEEVAASAKAAAAAAKSASTTPGAADSLSVPPQGTGTPAKATPRVSSEDDFDLVSNASNAGEEKAPSASAPAAAKAAAAEDDGDSDWE